MKTCPYCEPLNNHSLHLEKRVEKLLFPIEATLRKFPKLFSVFNKSAEIIFHNAFRMLLVAGLSKETEISDNDEQIYNRTLVVVCEARKLNVPIKVVKFLGKTTNFFSITINGKKRFFEGLPLLEIGRTHPIEFDDKINLKRILKDNKLPHAEGEIFLNYKKALSYVKKIGFPVVVKPRQGSLSKHTTLNIQSEKTLQAAIRSAKIICSEFVVEKFIEGKVYRITLLNYSVAACCLREPPNIIGDNKHTIEELVKIKNAAPLRGKISQKNFSLHQIPVNDTTISLLKEKGLTLKSIIPKNKKVYLHNKVILASGADIHDQTEKMHSENSEVFEKVAKLCRAEIIGIDFICKDISKPYYEQESAIIEANSMPYIDMHHYPVTGKAQNVAKQLLEYYINLHKFKNGYGEVPKWS